MLSNEHELCWLGRGSNELHFEMFFKEVNNVNNKNKKNMQYKTLTSMFESNKEDLKNQLNGLSLPKDVAKIQTVVESYLNSIFAGDGEYRQSLTQAEDYILQGAIALLNAQQSMIKEFAVKPEPMRTACKSTIEEPEAKARQAGLQKEQYPHALLGSAIGGAVGGLVVGTWGAVFGSIAGTAVMLYYASDKLSSSKPTAKPAARPATAPKVATDKPLNIDAFIAIIHNICDSIDSLINSFRVQIKRVVNQYENQEKPTLEKDYNSLLETIQSLLGYERTHDATEDKYVGKLKERIEELAESLDAYNIEVIDYDGSNDDLFSKTANPKVVEPKMVMPAFVKDDKVIIKGKLFVNE